MSVCRQQKPQQQQYLQKQPGNITAKYSVSRSRRIRALLIAAVNKAGRQRKTAV